MLIIHSMPERQLMFSCDNTVYMHLMQSTLASDFDTRKLKSDNLKKPYYTLSIHARHIRTLSNILLKLDIDYHFA